MLEEQDGGQCTEQTDSQPLHLEGVVSFLHKFVLCFRLPFQQHQKKSFYMKDQLTLLLFIFLREEMKSIEIKSKA